MFIRAIGLFSSPHWHSSKAVIDTEDEAEEDEEAEQATGDENEEGEGESLGGDEEDAHDAAMDYLE